MDQQVIKLIQHELFSGPTKSTIIVGSIIYELMML